MSSDILYYKPRQAIVADETILAAPDKIRSFTTDLGVLSRCVLILFVVAEAGVVLKMFLFWDNNRGSLFLQNCSYC